MLQALQQYSQLIAALTNLGTLAFVVALTGYILKTYSVRKASEIDHLKAERDLWKAQATSLEHQQPKQVIEQKEALQRVVDSSRTELLALRDALKALFGLSENLVEHHLAANVDFSKLSKRETLLLRDVAYSVAYANNRRANRQKTERFGELAASAYEYLEKEGRIERVDDSPIISEVLKEFTEKWPENLHNGVIRRQFRLPPRL